MSCCCWGGPGPGARGPQDLAGKTEAETAYNILINHNGKKQPDRDRRRDPSPHITVHTDSKLIGKSLVVKYRNVADAFHIGKLAGSPVGPPGI